MAPSRPQTVQDLWASSAQGARVIILIIERDLTTEIPTYWTALMHSHSTNPMVGVVSSIHVSKSSILNLPQAGLDTCTVLFHVNDYDLEGLILPPNVRATFYLQNLFSNEYPVDLRQFTGYEIMVKESLTTRMHNLGRCTPYVWAEILRHPRAVPSIFLCLSRSLPRSVFNWNPLLCMDILYTDLVTPANLPPHIGIPTFSNYTRPVAVIGTSNLRNDLRFSTVEWQRVNQLSRISQEVCQLPRFRARNILNANRPDPIPVEQPRQMPMLFRAPAGFPLAQFAQGPPPPVQRNANLAGHVFNRPIQRQIAEPAPPGVEPEPIAAPRAEAVEPYIPEAVPGPSRPRPESSSSSTRSCNRSTYQELLDSDDSDSSDSEEEGEIRDNRGVERRHYPQRNHNHAGPGYNPYRLAEMHARGIRPGGAFRPRAAFRPVVNQPRFNYFPNNNHRLCFNCWRRGHMKNVCPWPRSDSRYPR